MTRAKKLLASLIIAISVLLAVLSVWEEPLIVDEVPHVGAGYSYLVTGDYRLNPEHPPLAKDLGTFPLLFLDLDQSAFEGKPWTTDINGQWEFGRNLVYGSGNDAQLVAHVVKIPMLLFFVLSAILIFKWGHKLYGDKGAFIALILFSFSPTVMAHSRFVTTDLAALFGVLTASYFFINWLKKQTHQNFVKQYLGGRDFWLASVFFGIALLCKFSTILLVPFFLVLAFIYGLVHSSEKKFLFASRQLLVASCLILIGFIVVVWPVYYLHTMNEPVQKQYSDTSTLLESYGNRLFADPVVWASGKPVLRAAAQYGLGLLMATQRSVGGNTTYFLGEVSRTGWRSYFPIVYFIKEPLPFWGLVLIALLAISTQGKRKKEKGKKLLQTLNSKPRKGQWPSGLYWLQDHFTEFAMLVWLVIYWGTSIHSTLNIGVRHLLPVFPFTILLISGQLSKLGCRLQVTGYRFKKWRVAGSWLLVALLSWYVYENLHVFPYYLTYFNQTVGGASQGYKYVVDSNLDWGQDLVRFSNWVKANNISKIETDYFGWADPYYYMGDSYIRLYHDKYQNADDFIAHNQSNGWMAISATFLRGSEGSPDQPNPINYLWLNSFEPVTVVGNSIFVYRITR